MSCIYFDERAQLAAILTGTTRSLNYREYWRAGQSDEAASVLCKTSTMSFAIMPRHAMRAGRLAHSARFFSTSVPACYENVLVSRPKPGVALITLNRPKALNALNAAHFRDIASALKEADDDAGVGAMVLTGSDRAFAGT